MQSRREAIQTRKNQSEFKSGMMELQAIRARLNEGIERNGISDMKEHFRIGSTKELRVLSTAHLISQFTTSLFCC
jgi:hypothetical protein